MRILSLFLGVAVIANSMGLRAEDKKVYEAVVDTEQGEYVLSGPGTKYYPTQKLKNGERVMVHRHDPGGLCMIAPPAGSFSWVRASQVEREDEKRGWIKTNRVVVHTGSVCNPEECTTIQADLSKGDAVQILGEKEFQFDDGPRLMLKISPVKGEWRWISRKSIVPADSYRSSPSGDDQPSTRKRNGPIADSEAFAQPISTSTLNPDDRLDAPGADPTNRSDLDAPSGRDRLSIIDQQFRDMIKQDPPTWNLDVLEAQYRQLDTELNQKMITSMINLRLDAVKRYRKIHHDYLDFHKLTSATKQRDAELLVQQTQFQSMMSGSAPPSMTAPEAQPVAQTHAAQPIATAQAPTAAAPQFDGAGIVQKMSKTFPGGPQYVLISPEGKMLSFLQTTPGVDLNRYNGRSVGIVGQRVHRNDWNADVIAVQTLQPVQLRATR